MLRSAQRVIQRLIPGAGWMCASSAFAHEGHGLSGSHWHATDLWGFVAFGVVLAIAVWQGRK